MKSRMWTCITALMLLSALAIPVQLAAQNALGLKYTVLYTFTGGTDGAVPMLGTLIQDENGNLYGTTSVAGDLSACANGSSTGCGVVFKVDPKGNETVLYPFTGGADGGQPFGGLVGDEEGNLYGTTHFGTGSSPSGTVFKVDPAPKETTLYGFTGGTDGNTPYAGPIRDKEGNLYGTTIAGGNLSSCGGQGCGVVFKVDPTNHETVLYAFTGPDGKGPIGVLLLDDEGNLYGTTQYGGPSNAGVVFKVDPTNHETVLYPFFGRADGGQPVAGLIRDEAGNLYGTASSGGTSSAGVVFKVDPTGKETVLYAFTGGADGSTPEGGLVRDPQGNLYGTTFFGGNPNGPCGGFCGVVFKLSPTGKETVLYGFNGEADGANPGAGLLRDNHGDLYGTTQYGGDLDSTQGYCGIGCGVVFKISVCSTARCQSD